MIMSDILISDVKKYILQFKSEEGRIPKLDEVSSKFKISKSIASNIYQKLKKDKFLILKRTRYLKNNAIEEEKNIKVNVKDKVKEYFTDIPLLIIKVCMGIIGIGAIILSVYYTGIWLIDYLVRWLAFLLSAIMVLFSVIAFEVIIIMFVNGKKYIPLCILFIGLWSVVLIFSMTSTVAGQYNTRMKTISKNINDNSTVIIQRETYNLLLEEEKDIVKRIENKEREREPFMKIMEKYESPEDRQENAWEYWDAYKKVENINKSIEKLYIMLVDKRKEKKEYLITKSENEIDSVGAIEETTNESKSFYLWVSDILQVNAKYIEFWLSVFPAVFIDIIAPLSIAISMFLKRKRKGE